MQNTDNPLRWLPSLYFFKGLPYVVLMVVSTVLYKQMGLSNAEVAFYTSWFYLPWVLKPFWHPYVSRIATRRWWILLTEIIIGASMGSIAFTLPSPFNLQASLALFWVASFSCAFHNVSADGLYLDEMGPRHNLIYFIRTTFYRLATFVAQGILVMVAGNLQVMYRGSMGYSWSLVFYGLSLFLLLTWIWHGIFIPYTQPAFKQLSIPCIRQVLGEVSDTTKLFFRKPYAIYATIFMLLFKLPEGLLSKVSILFLIDGAHRGGLGLSPQEYGLVAGTIGVAGLSLGGILGAKAIAHGGIKRWLWPMALSLTIPNATYLYLSYYMPDNIFIVGLCVFLEQVGYGFGFVAYIMFIKRFVMGYLHKAHLTLGKAFMALSIMLPAMFSGFLQQAVGYRTFFIIVLCCSVATIIATILAIITLKAKEARK